MHPKKFIPACAVAFVAAVSMPASAVVLTSASLAAGNSAADFSAAGQVAFDLDLAAPGSPSELTFTIETGDLGGPLAFDAIVRNLSLFGISNFNLFLEDATFGTLGTAHGFAGFAKVSGGASAANIHFNPLENADFFIGDPVGTASAADWQIDIAGLNAGDTFSLTVQAVPAPATLPLVLAAFGIAGFAGRRARNRG